MNIEYGEVSEELQREKLLSEIDRIKGVIEAFIQKLPEEENEKTIALAQTTSKLYPIVEMGDTQRYVDGKIDWIKNAAGSIEDENKMLRGLVKDFTYIEEHLE